MAENKGTGVLTAIALFKLVKVAALVGLGVGALTLQHGSDVLKTAHRWLREAGIDPNQRLVTAALVKISGVDRRRLEALGVASFVYAAVFLVEGIGLLLRKRWAEYLTVFVTASFVPFEIYEIARKPSVLKGVGLALNVAIVVYLIVRLWLDRKHSAA